MARDGSCPDRGQECLSDPIGALLVSEEPSALDDFEARVGELSNHLRSAIHREESVVVPPDQDDGCLDLPMEPAELVYERRVVALEEPARRTTMSR